MKLLFTCLLAFYGLLQHLAAQTLPWVSKVGATSVTLPKKVFYVQANGSVNDTSIIQTKAIQSAIDACAKNGGGIVTFKPGVYVTGSIFLQSNVQLLIDKDVTILGSQNFSDYPEINTRIAGIEMVWPAALINIINAKNASIKGKGVVNARGRFCWEKYWVMRKDYDKKGLRWIVDYDAKRVRTVLVQNASNIRIEDVTFKNAGFWTVQLLYSTKITVDGIVIRNNDDGKGPSTDGIDVDSSSWVLIQNCDIDCNDDNFCLKAGRDADGLRVNKPTEYVVIKNCTARKGSGLITFGSETSGGIRHVLATNLTGKGTSNGLLIKSATTRGGIVEDIYFSDISLDSVSTAFHFLMNWNPAYSYSTLPKEYSFDSVPIHWKTLLQKVTPIEKGIPQFKNVFISNIKGKGIKKLMNGQGLATSYLDNFSFTNVQLQGNVVGEANYANGWIFKNVVLESDNTVPLQILNSKNMNVNQ